MLLLFTIIVFERCISSRFSCAVKMHKNDVFVCFRAAFTGFDCQGFGSVGLDCYGSEDMCANISTQAVLNLIKFTDLGANEGQSATHSVSFDQSKAVPTRVLSDLTNNTGVIIVT